MKDNFIKYDKKHRKVYMAVSIVSLIFVVIFFLLMLADKMMGGLSSDFTGLIVLLTIVSEMAVPVFIIGLLLFIRCSVYLGRLSKNGFTVPDDKKDYDNSLVKLPRSSECENRYAKDSVIAAGLSLLAYTGCLAADIIYLVKWTGYGEEDSIALFIMLMIFHLIFIILAVIYFRQSDKEKYADEVDVSLTKKKRVDISKAVIILLAVGGAAAFSVSTAHSMTKYVYKSRNGHYDKTIEDFKEGATMTVSSSNLHDGVWDDIITNTDKGDNLSPQLSFSSVEGAGYYVIYMVDESANNWVHWVADGITVTELETGANEGSFSGNPDFKYVGPYPPPGSGEHVYTVYVYALKDKPDGEYKFKFNTGSFSGDYIYYDILNIAERGDIDTYGNVISYGYISGVYER